MCYYYWSSYHRYMLLPLKSRALFFKAWLAYKDMSSKFLLRQPARTNFFKIELQHLTLGAFLNYKNHSAANTVLLSIHSFEIRCYLITYRAPILIEMKVAFNAIHLNQIQFQGSLNFIWLLPTPKKFANALLYWRTKA